MRRLRRAIGALATMLLAPAALLVAWGLLRGPSADRPWTPLDLGEPAGLFTGRKLAALHGDLLTCERLLRRAGVQYRALPTRREGQCGFDDAVRFAPGGSRRIAFAPTGLGVSCPVAAALAMWEWNIVQPAARRRFGSAVTRIEHFGSYNCRHIRGRGTSWSEHSTANAIDVAGFTLADGTRISVARNWRGRGDKAEFLRDVRAGACKLFATVLSPDYNAAHADHLHLDQAARGAAGWRACR